MTDEWRAVATGIEGTLCHPRLQSQALIDPGTVGFRKRGRRSLSRKPNMLLSNEVN
jgi:hypothetical protein